MKSHYHPLLLIILDGFGMCPDFADSPINEYNAPFWYHILKQYPYTKLHAAGKYVGLPKDYPGNSQVGHVTLGTGHIIKQPITMINELIENNHFYSNQLLQQYLSDLAKQSKRLHIMGIASHGTAHGTIDHLFAYIKFAKKYDITIFLHLFLDGRDVLPKSAAYYIEQLEPFLDTQCVIATLHGRFFAMDRDENVDRTAKSISVLFHKEPVYPFSWRQALHSSYQQGITDEFFEPCRLEKEGIIKQGDGIISTNTRPERIVQLIRHIYEQRIQPAWIISPIIYDKNIKTIPLLTFEPIHDTLKAAWSDREKAIFTIAETEKWAHVTYFFDGMQNIQYPYETRLQVASLKQRTYERYPAMSAPIITDTILRAIDKKEYDLFIINYANADMVAHAGNPTATAQAITCLDDQLQLLYKKMETTRGSMIITADHGNAECVLDKKTGILKKAHTANKVPFIMIPFHSFMHEKCTMPKKLSDVKNFICKHFLVD
ncbi:MAG TPA: 2,3-bisphosphoglycerate-independent phosphoglycerate mutase [Patescibacteria group bacterium]|jgi:2,3-bisphosphoglycerate-independent phosphoglycerate mutase|nr:2,3-bisphosphoglycerate-independent phosphoglycerate mutase [Patescibacteria group bacterium]